MTELIVLNQSHCDALFDIWKRSEKTRTTSTIDVFKQTISRLFGYVVISGDGTIIGCISFGDYHAGADITIHCFIDPEFHGRWMTKSIYNEVFDFVFEKLDLPRASGYCVEGLSDRAGLFLESLGFKQEGVLRERISFMGYKADLVLYGMLKSERRALRRS